MRLQGVLFPVGCSELHGKAKDIRALVDGMKDVCGDGGGWIAGGRGG